MKKFLKYSGYILLTLIAFILVYLGCARVLSRLIVRAEPTTQPEIVIYLKSNGIHTDMLDL